MTSGLFRVGIIAGIAVIALAGLSLALSFLIPTEMVRRAVAAHISAIAGQTVTVTGKARIVFRPWPSVRVDGVEVGGANGGANVLEAERITARLSLRSLVLARLEVAGLQLTKPKFSFLVDGEGRSNWRSGASLLSLFVPAEENDIGPRLGDLDIEGGHIAYRDERARRNGEISDLHIRISWPLIGSSLNGSGRFRVQGEDINFQGTLDRPAALFRRDISPFELIFDTAAVRAKFTGNALAGRDVHLDGKLMFSSPSLKLLAGWLAPAVQNAPNFGPIEGESRLTIVDRVMTLDNAVIKSAGSRGEGTLAFAFGATRTGLQGTMDFDQLDARPVLDMQIPTKDTPAGSFIDGQRLGPIDVDMRLSVARLSLGASIVQRAALSLFAREGHVEASIGDGAIFGGRIGGKLSITSLGEGQLRSKATLALSNIQVDDALRATLGVARLTGVGTLNLDLTGQGQDVGAMLRSLNGEGKLRLVSGVAVGFDLTSLTRRADRAAPESLADARGGRTVIELASASFRFADGVATTQDALIRGTGYRVGLRGQIDPRDRTLNLDGVISPQIGTEAVRALELPFTVRGPWFEPTLGLSGEGFGRRSSAPAQ